MSVILAQLVKIVDYLRKSTLELYRTSSETTWLGTFFKQHFLGTWQYGGFSITQGLVFLANQTLLIPFLGYSSKKGAYILDTFFSLGPAASFTGLLAEGNLTFRAS